MAIPVMKQLEAQFPYPKIYSNLQMQKHNIPNELTQEKYIKRSLMTDSARCELQKAHDAYNEFMGILHSNNCDIIKNNLSFEYKGKSNVISYGGYYDNTSAYYVSQYLRPILTELDNRTNGFIKTEILKIRDALLNSQDILDKQLKILEKGSQGEEYVENELELIKNTYKHLQNVRFPYSDSKGDSCEIDLYIMTPKGLLICEVKNWGDKDDVFHVHKDGQWVKNPDSAYPEIITPSPFAQNTRHTVASDKLLKDNGIYCKLIPVIIIANEMVQIKNESNNAIIRASEIYNFIENLPYPCKYSRNLQDRIMDILQENNMEEACFPLQVWDDVATNGLMNQIEEHMQTLIELRKFADSVKGRFRAKWGFWKTIKKLLIIAFILLIIGCFIFQIYHHPYEVKALLACGILFLFLSIAFK